VVTGAGSGIGWSCAEVLGREGFIVVGLGRRQDRLRSAKVDPWVCDVADVDQTAEVIGGVIDTYQRIDVLVNAAGLVRSARLEDFAEEDIDTLISVNLRGTLNVIRSSLPGLRRVGGAIVNLSSTLALRPTPGAAVYAATKGAVDALTRALAVELAVDGIRVNAIAPSLVRSDIWLSAGMDQAGYEALLAARGREYPLGRVGEPADIAELVAFLASPRASWITGAVIPIDGGSSVGTRPRT
jgi:NAD(P)-dependent dehydrogenase (short-subunit alcohol dehydrogenase family)